MNANTILAREALLPGISLSALLDRAMELKALFPAQRIILEGNCEAGFWLTVKPELCRKSTLLIESGNQPIRHPCRKQRIKGESNHD